ncbi:hypothetical protein EFL95_06150 [Nocardioides marmorisolisilvae]|uniref:Choice-of-anchor G family protein n=1 Tax=Nocardioides marmorisolisilvae TaxID=1542737 RepID=A0A3N0DSR5_9ACTN|nr:hypothetical protein EFL95_06150 [Nocardioides marmorisolisilvae]
MLRFGAIVGAAALSTLAIAPAFAAASGTSQSSAQSLKLSIAGNSVIAQQTTAANDGSSETVTDNSTVPTLADLLPNNVLLGAGVAPQAAVAKPDGTSYACSGIAGTGGGIVTVGDSDCNLNGEPLTIDLAHLDLGNVILGTNSALGSALAPLDVLLTPLGKGVTDLVNALSSGLAGTPLGEIKIGGSLSAIYASCQADPDHATGAAHLVDTQGGSDSTAISITLPGVADPIILLNLPANPGPNTSLFLNTKDVVATLTDALTTELNTAVGGALQPLNLGGVLTQIRTAVVNQLIDNLQPLLTAINDNLLNIVLNKQVVSDGGKKIEVTALTLDVLPAAAQFTGSSLISGEIGKVSCGPNTRIVTPPTVTPTPTDNEKPPTVVDSGVAGQANHTARDVLTATAALMLLAGTAGLIGYRRMLTK